MMGLEIVGAHGDGAEVPLDEQPQSMPEAIDYAKWACIDWARVVVREDGRCVGIAKVPDGQRGESRGVWFEGVGSTP